MLFRSGPQFDTFFTGNSPGFKPPSIGLSACDLAVEGNALVSGGNWSSAISSTASGQLRFNTTANHTLSGVLSGDMRLLKQNTGTLTLSGANTYTGSTTIAAGTLSVTGTLSDATDVLNSGTYSVQSSDTINSLSGAGAVLLASAKTLTTGDAGDDTIAGVISGGGALTKVGSGTLDRKSTRLNSSH